MGDILKLMPTFALSLGLTILLEGVVALIFRLHGRDLLLFLLVNLLTNPVAVYLNLVFGSICPEISVFAWQIPIEVAVVAVEGILYFKLSEKMRLAWLFAIVANVFSYGAGVLLNFVF